jgi:hypothetical protein
MIEGGKETWVSFTASPLPDESVFVVARDSTERHRGGDAAPEPGERVRAADSDQ